MKNPKVSVKILDIDPELAAKKLAGCKANRNSMRKHVNAFVLLIREKRFRNYGIIYANGDGDYYDGQHRLQALIQTGATFKFIIIGGLEKEDMNMMVDSGKKRTTAQRLENIGYTNGGLLSASIEECLDLTQHWKRTVSMVFADHVLAYLKENPDLVQYASHWPGNPVHDVQTKLLVALQHLTSKIDSDKCDIFFMKITQRESVEPGDIFYAFFKMLESPDVVNQDNATTRNLWIKNGLLLTWNAFYKGETLEQIIPSSRAIVLAGLEDAKTALTPEPEANPVDDPEGDEPEGEEVEEGETVE